MSAVNPKDGSDSRWTTHSIALVALLTACAMALSFVEIPNPLAAFLKYDPSGIVPVLCALWFGAWPAALVGVLSWVPHLFLDPVGALMSILVNLALALPVAWTAGPSRRKGQEKPADQTGGSRSRRSPVVRMVVAMVVGALVATVVALLANLVVTPLYSSVPVSAVAAMILPILLPFNLVKAAINCVVAALVDRPLGRLVRRRDAAVSSPDSSGPSGQGR